MTDAHSILIVEDDTEFQKTLMNFFRSESPDYRVSAVPSLPETFPVLQDAAPDVVLLDLKLGKDSGLDVLKLLRSDSRFRDTRVIVVTGDDGLERRKETLALGADDFLSKPVALRDLQEVLVKIKMNRYATHGPSVDESSRKKKQAHREVLVFSKSGSDGSSVNDFVDVRFQKDRLLMVLAEVRANGADPGLTASQFKSLSDRFLPLLLEARSDLYLKALNERLAAESLAGQIQSVMAAVLDLRSRSLHFSGTNAQLPIVLPLGQNQWRQIAAPNDPSANERSAQTTIPVQEGDRIFMYSGGSADLMDSNTFRDKVGAAEPHFSDLKDLLETKARLRSEKERRPGFILFQIVPHFLEGKKIRSISEALPLLRHMEAESRFRGYVDSEFQAFLFSLEIILRDVFKLERDTPKGEVQLEIEINCKYIFFSVRPTGFWAKAFPRRNSRLKAVGRAAIEIGGKLQELKLSDDGRVVSGIRYRNPFD